jgi:cytochrome P450
MTDAFAPDRAAFYLGDPHAAFRRLRAEDPLHWYEPGRFWCVTRHSDVLEISRAPRTFSSAHGTQLFQIRDGAAGLRSELQMAKSIIQMDPPEHNRHRKLAIEAFTPRMVARLEPRVREIARESLAAIRPGEVFDFVERVAIPLPMLVIAELLGVPSSDHRDFRRWSDAMIEAGGSGPTPETAAVLAELFAYITARAAECRRAPREDVLTRLALVQVDGQGLNDFELAIFCMTLLVAGNETTRNLISGGMRTLIEHPDQWTKLHEDPAAIPNAVEEMLRFVTPVRNFCRRVQHDTELRDKKLREGEWVVLCYASANRDETVFGADSERFDVTRADARRHVSFGFGEHLCLGASLARLEARVMFEELAARGARWSLAGEPRPLPSTLMNGLLEMPVVFREKA